MSDEVTSATATGPGEPQIVVLPDPAAVSAAAAAFIAETLEAATAARGRADWVTTGGSTPVGIYPLLAEDPLRSWVPWDRVHLWWSDDRFVPRDHPLSNVLPVESILLSRSAQSGQSGTGEYGIDVELGVEDGVNMPVENVHPFPCTEAIARGVGPDWAAASYERLLRESELPLAGNWPVFDLVLLGVGPDGHVMSIFPDSAAFDSPAWTAGVPAPTHVEPHMPRVTLTPGVLGAARQVLVVAAGAGKADVVARIFGPERDERALPAQLVRREGVTWILDAAAAAGLESDRPD